MNIFLPISFNRLIILSKCITLNQRVLLYKIEGNLKLVPRLIDMYSKSNLLLRPKQTWKKLTEKDCREWKLTTVDPQERSTWRSGVRSAMRAASQLPGKGPTDVDDAPAPARKSKIRL